MSKQSAFDIKTIGDYVARIIIPIASFVLVLLKILPQQAKGTRKNKFTFGARWNSSKTAVSWLE